MSRRGKLPIVLPEAVTVEVTGNAVSVHGPKGDVARSLPPMVALEQDGQNLWVRRASDAKQARAFQGLVHSLVSSAVEGVTTGFTRGLEIVGLGYRAEVQGQQMTLQLGFCHPVVVTIPDGVTATIERQTQIKLDSVDKELVGQVAARLRALRPPDAYKGKGVRYAGEAIRLKAGKSAVGSGF